jgi:hypothetical protein
MAHASTIVTEELNDALFGTTLAVRQQPMATPDSNDGDGPPPGEAAPDEAAPHEGTAPSAEAHPAAPPDEAALPSEEMGFSNSTLHWLSDGDRSRPTTGQFPITLPSFDPTAPVAGRRRAVLVVGGAAAVALVVAGALYIHAYRHRPPPVATAPDPARVLTARAERALAENRVAEALDLAKLALVADARFADAQFVVATCERARNDLPAAREAYRQYLALAPLGNHAEAARAALASLAP